MTREQEIDYVRRRENEELMRSIRASVAEIEAIHYELATRYAAKAEALEADLDWQPAAVD